MRILLVGSEEVFSIENHYIKYLREAGEEVSIFPAQSYFYKYYYKSIYRKILYKAGLSGILYRINRALLKKADEFRPHVIWVFKGMELFPSTLKEIRTKGIWLANYNPDNPFIFSGSGSGNKNISESLKLYDLHFTYNMEVKKKLESEYRLNTVFLPFGFELDDETFQQCSRYPEILRACFVGNPDKKRAEAIKEMADAGIQIDLYGNGWKDFVAHSMLKVFPAVYKHDFWRIMRSYRLQLNLMRVHNEDSHNMRTFEVPAVGGIMLAPATSEHRTFFSEGTEAFLFSDVKESIEYAKHILSLGEAEAGLIRSNARIKSLTAGYSYKDRAAAVIDNFTKLQSGGAL